MLHEYEMMVAVMDGPTFLRTLHTILPKIVSCIASDNWRLCEKVLSLWRSDHFVRLLSSDPAQVMKE